MKRVRWWFALVAAALVAGPNLARAADVDAICRSVSTVSLPAADRPDAQTAKSLAGCDSEALYYGIGQKADPVRARQCAYTQLGPAPLEGDKPFGGSITLMTIYANGVGADRNLDLALRLACQEDYDGFIPVTLRVIHLAELKAKRWTGRNFSYCDDADRSFDIGRCAAFAERRRDGARQSSIAATTASWSPAEKAAFAKVIAAHEAFVQARTDNEVDLSGTLRGNYVIAARARERDDFIAFLREIDAGRLPKRSAQDLKTADAQLNAAYRTIQSAVRLHLGTVEADGVKQTQRAWLAYRDAWIALARIRYPTVAANDLNTALTRKRTAQLRDLASS